MFTYLKQNKCVLINLLKKKKKNATYILLEKQKTRVTIYKIILISY